ncbi:MAG: TetR/AcrR family transcriptional regulator [Devosia sp.]
MLPLPTSSATAEDSYHHGDLAQALVDAGLEAMATGSPLPGLRELARRVGVSSAAPYRHFRNRDELVAAIAAEGFHRFARLLQQAAAGRPADLQLPAIGRAYVRFARENPPLFQLMFSPEIDRIGDATLKVAMEATLAPLTSAATHEAGRRDPLDATLGAWALMHGLAQLLLDPGLLDLDAERSERLVAGILQTFVAGLRATPGATVLRPGFERVS